MADFILQQQFSLWIWKQISSVLMRLNCLTWNSSGVCTKEVTCPLFYFYFFNSSPPSPQSAAEKDAEKCSQCELWHQFPIQMNGTWISSGFWHIIRVKVPCEHLPLYSLPSNSLLTLHQFLTCYLLKCCRMQITPPWTGLICVQNHSKICGNWK